jgi:hypothetical protein
MSMTGAFLRVRRDVLERCIADPQFLHSVAFEWNNIVEEFDVGRYWDALHFLLSELRRRGREASGNPADTGGYAIHGARVANIGAATAYGPIRYLADEEINEVTAMLRLIDEKFLCDTFDAARMDAAGVYPGHWSQAGDAIVGEVIVAFQELKAFYQRAQTEQTPVIAFIV